MTFPISDGNTSGNYVSAQQRAYNVFAEKRHDQRAERQKTGHRECNCLKIGFYKDRQFAAVNDTLQSIRENTEKYAKMAD